MGRYTDESLTSSSRILSDTGDYSPIGPDNVKYDLVSSRNTLFKNLVVLIITPDDSEQYEDIIKKCGAVVVRVVFLVDTYYAQIFLTYRLIIMYFIDTRKKKLF